MAKILVVDDNQLVRSTTRAMLESGGHEVVDAADGHAALELARNSKPDLVLTDIVMPDKEGIGLIMELRSGGYKNAIIAMSGGGQIGPKDLLTMARELGADDCLTKPFRRADLIAKVSASLARSGQ
jgi:DNA-binding response OmpR family regulator